MFGYHNIIHVVGVLSYDAVLTPNEDPNKHRTNLIVKVKNKYKVVWWKRLFVSGVVTTYFPATLWGPFAKKMLPQLKRGTRVLLEGTPILFEAKRGINLRVRTIQILPDTKKAEKPSTFLGILTYLTT